MVQGPFLVFTDAAQIGGRNIAVTDEEKAGFVEKVYRPYLQSVNDHINGRMVSTELISFMSVFDPCHLPDKEEELSNYGMEKMKTHMKFYGTVQRVQLNQMEDVPQPDIDTEETELEWKLFQ